MTKEKNNLLVVEENNNSHIISVAEEDLYEMLLDDNSVKTNEENNQLPVKEQKPEQMENKSDDWRSSGKSELFPQHLEKELGRIKKPSQIRGNRAEMERAKGQYMQLCSDISRALRSDYEGVLDAEDIDRKRHVVEQYVDQIELALDGIKRMMQERKKRRRAGDDPELVKEATAPHFNGMQIVITPFERAVVGALINGVVAGGRNMEELYSEAKSKYDIKPREELSIFQIMTDMGYPCFRDRLRLGDNEDPSRTSGFGEWSSAYFS